MVPLIELELGREKSMGHTVLRYSRYPSGSLFTMVVNRMCLMFIIDDTVVRDMNVVEVNGFMAHDPTSHEIGLDESGCSYCCSANESRSGHMEVSAPSLPSQATSKGRGYFMRSSLDMALPCALWLAWSGP